MLVLAASLLTGVRTARADCIGPTFSHSGGDVAHGELVTVTGIIWSIYSFPSSTFGDNCYDTGPPPPGEGSLGLPLTGIEVYMEQGGSLHLVAVGNANQDYVWEVQVPIPSVLDVGDARVVVMHNGLESFNENPAEMWVTSDRKADALIEPMTFGPVVVEQPEAGPDAGFAGTNWTPVIALVATTITIAAVLVLVRRRSMG